MRLTWTDAVFSSAAVPPDTAIAGDVSRSNPSGFRRLLETQSLEATPRRSVEEQGDLTVFRAENGRSHGSRANANGHVLAAHRWNRRPDAKSTSASIFTLLAVPATQTRGAVRPFQSPGKLTVHMTGSSPLTQVRCKTSAAEPGTTSTQLPVARSKRSFTHASRI